MAFVGIYALNILLLVLCLAASEAVAPASSPSLATVRCRNCPSPGQQSPMSLNLTILIETDVAQFYSYSSEGALLVYFVARATFSEPPSQLQLADFEAEDGIAAA